MNIDNVTTSIRVGHFELYPEHPRNHIRVLYDTSISKADLRDNSGRVYLFTINGEIKKIGGSSSTGGILTTLSFYVTSMTGSPGKPRFILHLLIRDELEAGNEVEIYMIRSPQILAKVSGLFDHHAIEIGSFKEMEEQCRNDYFEVERKHPDWNFKENNMSYPDDYAMEHIRYHQQRLSM